MPRAMWGALLLAASGCQAEVAGDLPSGELVTDRKADAPLPPENPDEPEAPAVPDPADPAPAPGTGAEREPNDDAAVATNAGVPALVVQGELAAGDRDWFVVRIVQHGGYVFETSTGDVGDDQATDTQLEVARADAPGEAIGFDDDSGEGYGSRVAVTLSPGTFLVQVSGFGGGVTGPYALAVHGPTDLAPEEPEAPASALGPAESDESEANDTIESADSMGTDPTAIGAELEPAGVDHFVFEATAGGTVTLETAPRVDGGATVDTVIELYGSDGVTLLGTDDDGADAPLFSRLTVELPAAGVYWARVRGYGALSQGGYRLTFVR